MKLYRDKGTDNKPVTLDEIKAEARKLAMIYAGVCEMMSFEEYLKAYYEEVK
jgi:hypothetical protein